MLPHDPAKEHVIWIDWAVWHLNLGVGDLAYLVVLSPAEWREAHEERLFELYYSELLAQGVAGYSRDQCWADYRLAALGHLLWMPFWYAVDTPEEIWLENLEDTLKAVGDLGVGELLV
jgi:hypothetical protein